MILELEDFRGDSLYTGKSLRRGDLLKQMKHIESLCCPGKGNFAALLCRIYGWERCMDDVPADYTYDLDAGILSARRNN